MTVPDFYKIRIDTFIRLEFEDGYCKQIHYCGYEYENDFDSLVAEHGNITHTYVNVIPFYED